MTFNEIGKTKFSPVDRYDTQVEDRIRSVFPNVEIELRVFLTLKITGCFAERSFSILREQRVKTELIHFLCCLWK